MHRACRNQRAFLDRRPRYSPGWAVGGWFIPLVNLVYPYLVMADIWKNSSVAAREGPEASRRSAGAPAGLVIAWWTLYLSRGFSGGFAGAFGSAFDQATGEPTPEGYVETATTALNTQVVASLVSSAAAVVAILVVQRITRWQEQAARRI